MPKWNIWGKKRKGSTNTELTTELETEVVTNENGKIEITAAAYQSMLDKQNEFLALAETNAAKEDLKKHADLLGFTGNTDSLIESCSSYSEALEQMIVGRAKQMEEEITEVEDETNEEVGEGASETSEEDDTTDKDDEPKDEEAAMAKVKEDTGLKGRALATATISRYPHLFKGE